MRLKDALNKDYGHLGVTFDKANTTDIDPSPDMVKGRNKKALTKILAQTAKIEIVVADHKATAGIATQSGKAKEIEIIGIAEAGVTEIDGAAQASVILDKLKANVNAIAYLQEKGVAEKAIPMIATMIMADKPIEKIAEALKGLNINLYQIDGFDKIKDLVSSFTGKFLPTGTGG